MISFFGKIQTSLRFSTIPDLGYRRRDWRHQDLIVAWIFGSAIGSHAQANIVNVVKEIVTAKYTQVVLDRLKLLASTFTNCVEKKL